MTILTLRMAFVDHDFVLQCEVAHILARGSFSKSFHHQVVLIRHHHKLHTFLPIAQTVEAEVLADEVLSTLLILLHRFGNLVCHMILRTLGSALSLYNIRVGLSRGCHKGKRHTGS